MGQPQSHPQRKGPPVSTQPATPAAGAAQPPRKKDLTTILSNHLRDNNADEALAILKQYKEGLCDIMPGTKYQSYPLLTMAVTNYNLDLIKAIVDAGLIPTEFTDESIEYAPADSRTSPLHEAVQIGSVEIVKYFIEEAGMSFGPTPSGHSGLVWLAHPDVTEEMIDYVLQPPRLTKELLYINTGMPNLLQRASTIGHLYLVDKLIRIGIDVNKVPDNPTSTDTARSPFVLACAFNSTPAVAQILLANGAKLHDLPNILNVHGSLIRPQLLEYVLPFVESEVLPSQPRPADGDPRTPLVRWLETGQRPNVNPIFVKASIRGDHELMSYLLDLGVDPNSADRLGHDNDWQGQPRSALGYCARLGLEPCVRLLLDKGAGRGNESVLYAALSDAVPCGNFLGVQEEQAESQLLVVQTLTMHLQQHSTNFPNVFALSDRLLGTTLIHAAMYYPRVLSYFLGLSDEFQTRQSPATARPMASIQMPLFDVNAGDVEGRTPLMHGAMAGKAESVQELLKISAVDVNAKDNHGKSALDWALLNGYNGVADMLQKETQR